MGSIVPGSRVQFDPDATPPEPWPDSCVNPTDLGGEDLGTVVLVEIHDGVEVALVIWDGNAEHYDNGIGDGMPSVWGWLVPVAALRLAEVSDAT